MTVRVAFFAAAKEVTGCDFLSLELDDAATLANIQHTLADHYPELQLLLDRSTWSLDHEYVTSETALYDGAEVGMIPPVSGG